MKISQLRKLMQQLPVNAMPTDPAWRNEYLRQVGLEPGDIYQELEMESRFVDTHRDVSFANAHVNLHSHNFYELLYCRNSCGAEYLVGSERYRLQKGDVVLVAPGVSHRPLLPDVMSEPYKRDVLWLSAEFMPLLYRAVPDLDFAQLRRNSLLRTAGTQWETIGQLFHNGVVEAETRAPGWELAVMGNTMTLLSCLYRAVLDRDAVPMRAEKPERLEQILAYIESHLAQKITLAEVARHFFVSESTITQLFRKKMGISFYRCITQQRLIAAKTLIEQGQLLENVATQTGFSDYSVFFRAFKQEYGISPRQYRSLQETAGKKILDR